MDRPAARVPPSSRQIGGGIFAPRPRLEWVDAAKGIGILLVVVAHVWTRGPTHDVIYTFHMPLFFLLSGYCAQPRPVDAFARGQARAMLVPYVAFLLILALADQLVEHVRGHLPIFRTWEQAVWALTLGGSELNGPFTIFWFIPCLAIARLCQNMLWHVWPDPCDPRWAAAMAVALALGLWIGARSDFSPLGLLSVPVALVLLWVGALWRTLTGDRMLLAGAAFAGVVLLFVANPPPLAMKLADYGWPLLSLPLAVMLSLGMAGLARLICHVRPFRALFVALGRRSLVIMYAHLAFIHYLAPYFGKGVLLAISIPGSMLLHEGLRRTRWGQRYFLGLVPVRREISYNRRVER